MRHVYRRPAVGAVHALDVLAQLLQLLRCERADEVLLAQEVEEGGQPAVVVGAAQVGEASRPLHVLRQTQPRVTPRALGEIGVRELTLARVFPDQAEERQRAAGTEPHAFVGVEPERVAGQADVDRDRPADVAVERLLLHRRAAAGTGHSTGFQASATRRTSTPPRLGLISIVSMTAAAESTAESAAISSFSSFSSACSSSCAAVSFSLARPTSCVSLTERPTPRTAVVARPRVEADTALRPSSAPNTVAPNDTIVCVRCCDA